METFRNLMFVTSDWKVSLCVCPLLQKFIYYGQNEKVEIAIASEIE